MADNADKFDRGATPDGRLEHHLLEGEAVTMYPYWAADLRTVIAGFRRTHGRNSTHA